MPRPVTFYTKSKNFEEANNNPIQGLEPGSRYEILVVGPVDMRVSDQPLSNNSDGQRVRVRETTVIRARSESFYVYAEERAGDEGHFTCGSYERIS